MTNTETTAPSARGPEPMKDLFDILSFYATLWGFVALSVWANARRWQRWVSRRRLGYPSRVSARLPCSSTLVSALRGTNECSGSLTKFVML